MSKAVCSKCGRPAGHVVYSPRRLPAMWFDATKRRWRDGSGAITRFIFHDFRQVDRTFVFNIGYVFPNGVIAKLCQYCAAATNAGGPMVGKPTPVQISLDLNLGTDSPEQARE